MKMLVVGIVSAAFVLGAGTFAFAQTSDGKGPLSFEQMKPYIEKMHPSLTEKEQKEMYKACHGNGGMMENVNVDMNRMMDNL